MWRAQSELALVSASQDRQPSPGALHGAAGGKPQGPGARGDALAASETTERPRCGADVMEAVLERHNRQTALRQVRAHQGRPGLDGMRVEGLPDVLRTHWLGINHQRLAGPSQPRGMTRVERPKPGSQEKRKLGRPCVLDRLIPQALLQGVPWRWDPTLSESRDGFRPGRNAQHAVAWPNGERISESSSASAPLCTRGCWTTG